MWKKALFWMGVFALIYSCRQEVYETGVEKAEEGERFPVSFSLSMGPGALQGTEIIPMTRADAGEYGTCVYNWYRLIVIKYVNSKWVVDQILDPAFKKSKDSWIDITEDNIRDNRIIGTLDIELRPGKYQMAVLVNMSHGVFTWNKTIKPGTIISTEENISPEEDLPVAFAYFANTDSAYMRQNPIFVNREVFTGNVAFTVSKAGELKTSSGTPPEIQLERRVGHFRYLLQEQKDKNLPPFKDTEHTFNGILNLPEGQYFGVGINVLGGVYYNREAPARALRFCCSNGYSFHISPKDGKKYLIPTINAHIYSPYIILDKKMTEGLSCTVDNIYISGQAGFDGWRYYADPFDLLLKVNTVFGVAFETTDFVWETSGGYQAAHIDVLKDIDVSTWFSPYFQWNQ